MNAYTIFGSERAMTTSSRPQGFWGSPEWLAAFSSLHVFPPLVVRKNPLAVVGSGTLPPERKVHPWRRKSHRPAKRISGFVGSIASPAQPVERFGPLRMRLQVFPPSLVL